MNLHNIVSGAISAVNPPRTAMIAVSTGSATSADGTQIPTYAAPRRVTVQVQELSDLDLKAAEGINLQGETKSIYLNGEWHGVVRGDGRGGDLITLDGRVWLVAKVLESWEGRRGWTKVLACLQTDPAAKP